jgi:hypothetical protein
MGVVIQDLKVGDKFIEKGSGRKVTLVYICAASAGSKRFLLFDEHGIRASCWRSIDELSKYYSPADQKGERSMRELYENRLVNKKTGIEHEIIGRAVIRGTEKGLYLVGLPGSTTGTWMSREELGERFHFLTDATEKPTVTPRVPSADDFTFSYDPNQRRLVVKPDIPNNLPLDVQIALCQKKWDEMWRLAVEGVDPNAVERWDGSGDTCAFCVNHQTFDSCHSCPIARFTEHGRCRGTPYDWWIQSPTSTRSCMAMRLFLRDVKDWGAKEGLW